jgi:phenylacetate-coenzyme A ligase PaaK-like adenylate-forming protein
VDLVPAGEVAGGAGRLARVLATTIGRRWMPLVRFDQGDLLLLEDDPAPCPCGNVDGPVAKAVEGRVGDLTWTAGKKPVTPGAIDRALAPLSGVDGIAAWQVTQEAEDRFRAAIVVSPGAREDLAAPASAALASLYGDGEPKRVTVRVETVPAILPEASGKYRPSRSEIALGKGTRLSKDRDWLESAA